MWGGGGGEGGDEDIEGRAPKMFWHLKGGL